MKPEFLLQKEQDKCLKVKGVDKRSHLNLSVDPSGNWMMGKGSQSMNVDSGGRPVINNQGAEDRRLKM